MEKYYPTPHEISVWADKIWEEALQTPVEVEVCDDSTLGMQPYFFVGHSLWKSRFVKLTPNNEKPFYVYWQPVENGPAPLCVHLPGYGCEINSHPDTVAKGFNVLEISPMGYGTPLGINEERLQTESVLPLTIASEGREGYSQWMRHCVIAILWAWQQPETLPDRVSVYGTSQGGGCSLILGSVLKGHGIRCVAADQPFLTNFPLANWRAAYEIAKQPFETLSNKKGWEEAWKVLGYVDTICHAHRLDVPVLLTSGSIDELCPPETIESLFEILPQTRVYMDIDRRPHGFTPEFIHLAWAWFRLYA